MACTNTITRDDKNRSIGNLNRQLDEMAKWLDNQKPQGFWEAFKIFLYHLGFIGAEDYAGPIQLTGKSLQDIRESWHYVRNSHKLENIQFTGEENIWDLIRQTNNQRPINQSSQKPS